MNIRKSKRGYILAGCALYNWSETQRMIEIADELYNRGYDIVFIGEGKYDDLLQNKSYIREFLPYDSKWYTSERIALMLGMDQNGNNYATPEEIRNIVMSEVELIKKYNPLAVMTGYRMSLTISARIANVPIVWCLSAALSKLYLKTVAEKASHIDELKRNKSLPYQEIRALFEDKIACERLLGACKTSQAWNLFLASQNMAKLTCDLDIYTGDLNLMSDARELFTELEETRRYKFIGPILNSQKIRMPEVVGKAVDGAGKRKKVLICIGSGGKRKLFQKILSATLSCDCDYFVSVVGILNQEDIDNFPGNYYFCEKFPLVDIAKQCDAAIIQGGQGTLYAVIAGKCPFVSLPATFEQRKNVENIISQNKCGEMIYAFDVTKNNIKRALETVLNTIDYSKNISRLSVEIGRYFENNHIVPELAADYVEQLIYEDRNLSSYSGGIG